MALSISYKGKRILVTGAGRGLGREIVETLHKHDAIIYALDLNSENLVKLKTDFPNVHTICVDLGNWVEAREAVQKCGPIDYLINNAGLMYFKPFLECSVEHFDDQWNINVKAVINVSQVVAQGMIDRGQGGCIINISSLGARVAAKSLGIYDTTKAALDMLTKSMGVELGKYNIRVNSVNPTVFRSDMTKAFLDKHPGGEGGTPYKDRVPLRRIARSYEIINTILFLMSEKASMITASSVFIDGGFTAN